MTKQEILAEIAAKIDGQGSAIDAGSALPGILRGILDLIPAEQVNSDWNATEGPAEILNKPTIPAGPLVIPFTIDNNNVVTLLDGAPAKAEIQSALRSGRQVIGLEYVEEPTGYELARQMLCTFFDLSGASFFSINGNTIDRYGTLLW